MLSYFRWVLFFIALFVTVMGGGLFLGNMLLTAPGPLDKTKNIVIARGAGPATMAKVLREEGVIEHDRLFRLALVPFDGIVQSQRSQVMHKSGAHPQAPKRFCAQLVRGILWPRLHDAIARPDVMQ